MNVNVNSVQPYWDLTFDAGGDPDPGQRDALFAAAGAGDLTDVVVFAHGWNNDLSTANALYDRFYAPFPGLLAAAPAVRFGYAGVHWPSMRFSDEPIPDFPHLLPGAAAGTPGTTADAPGAGNGLDPATRAALAAVFPGGGPVVDRIAALLDERSPDPARLAEFAAAVRELTGTGPRQAVDAGALPGAGVPPAAAVAGAAADPPGGADPSGAADLLGEAPGAEPALLCGDPVAVCAGLANALARAGAEVTPAVTPADTAAGPPSQWGTVRHSSPRLPSQPDGGRTAPVPGAASTPAPTGGPAPTGAPEPTTAPAAATAAAPAAGSADVTGPDPAAPAEGISLGGGLSGLGHVGSRIGGEVTRIGGRVWDGAKELLRQATYYAMKKRAGTVGERGLGPLLGELARRAPGVRVHLVGHSFGARLVSFALRGLPEGAAVCSVTLLQGAFSHYTFSGSLPFDASGGALRGMQRRVSGPVVACHSSHDEALSVFYPMASALAGDDESLLGLPERWGAMGHDGFQDLAGASALTLAAALSGPFPASGCVSVDASAVVCSGGPPCGAHSDICHEELARLVLLAAGRAGG